MCELPQILSESYLNFIKKKNDENLFRTPWSLIIPYRPISVYCSYEINKKNVCTRIQGEKKTLTLEVQDDTGNH